jgi:hypothetical protein
MFPYVASNQLDLFATDPPSGRRSDAGTVDGILVGVRRCHLFLVVPAGGVL